MNACRIYSKAIPEDLSPETVAAALELLPLWRRRKALAYRQLADRFLCAEAYLLLKQALYEAYALTGDFNFVCSKAAAGGKPSLEGFPDIHFNLSHCPKCVCCAVSDFPVGIDVEQIQFDGDLLDFAFNEEERQAILAASSPAVEFTRLWTMKESLLKLTGEGMSDDIRDVLSKRGCGIAFNTITDAEHSYVLCSAEFVEGKVPR